MRTIPTITTPPTNKPNSSTRVIVGMSGGVDSSVSALLLTQAGYQVEGLFMKNWEQDDTEDYCSATQDIADAQAICDELGIKLHKVNFAAEYWDHVFEHFLAEYRAGRTPNPDVWCNKEIKFKAFLEYATHLGADFIATGHYARNQYINNEYFLRVGLDANKDQSYFLYTLGQAQLAKTIFPIGHIAKPIVRELAKEHGFINHNKKDSTGICFIGERRFKDFLNQYLPAQPGDIETTNGEHIGRHDGLMFYTIGQRQGLGIGGLKQADEAPWYVINKDLKRNVLIVGQGHDHPGLFHDTIRISDLHWVADTPPELPLSCQAKVRYRSHAAACRLERSTSTVDRQLKVIFNEPQWAITPGQSVVFYQADICLGGGTINIVGTDHQS